MRNPFEVWRQRQARRRFMPQAKRSKTGTTAKFAVAALLLIVLVGALLESRRGGGAAAELVAHARENAVDPLDLVEVAGRARRLLFLADVRSTTTPKQFAAQVIERLAFGPGLDLVVLNVPADEQPHIDRYLATSPEDVSILLARPRAIREDDGASRSMIDLFRTIWRVNAELGAHRRVRVLAADHPQWPPVRKLSPHDAARIFGERDRHMFELVTERVLARSPNDRVLFFLDGLHVLRSGKGRMVTGGSAPIETTWLAARLAAQFPQDVYSILVDAVPSRALTPDVAAYRGTELGEPLRRAGTRTGIALRAGPALDAVARAPIRVVDTTGLEFALQPRTSPFSTLADAYIYFGS